jgi:hypothetical protein
MDAPQVHVLHHYQFHASDSLNAAALQDLSKSVVTIRYGIVCGAITTGGDTECNGSQNIRGLVMQIVCVMEPQQGRIVGAQI